MYGVVGYKTHAKMTLVVRREADGIRRYCHLGTGNYHPQTARIYTDYGLFTCDEDIGTDVHEIFLQLTSLTRTSKLRRLLQSPFNLHEVGAGDDRARERPRARRQARAHHRQAQRAGGTADHRDAVPRLAQRRAHRSDRARRVCAASRHPGRVRQHHGALDRRPLPRALARLLVRERRRSASCIWRAPTGWSATSSAASRSPSRCCTQQPRERIFKDLETYLADNTNAWELQADGSYRRIPCPDGTTPCDAQQQLLQRYAGVPAPAT